MSGISVQQLILAGSHFGHLTRRWNPKMKPYIFMEKNGIYIIDLYKTKQMLDHACETARKIVEKGDTVLFVGTKKQAKDIIRNEAQRSGMPYVNERWLGGMLTNFVTIRKSVKKLETLEKKTVDGTYDIISKKERLTLDKQRGKLETALSGIRDMKKLPGAVFVVDTLEEEIAVREARKLGIPVFAIVDTNSDPDPIDYPIPANDDAYKSIGLIMKTFTDVIIEGLAVAQAHQVEREEKDGTQKKAADTRRRTSRRRKGGSQEKDGGDKKTNRRRGGSNRSRGPKKETGGKQTQENRGEKRSESKPAGDREAKKSAPKKDE